MDEGGEIECDSWERVWENVEVEVTWRLPTLPDPSTVSSDEHWSALGVHSTHRRDPFPLLAFYLPPSEREGEREREKERQRERNGRRGYTRVHCPVNFETTFGKRVLPSKCTDRDYSVIDGELWKITPRIDRALSLVLNLSTLRILLCENFIENLIVETKNIISINLSYEKLRIIVETGRIGESSITATRINVIRAFCKSGEGIRFSYSFPLPSRIT